MVFPVGVRPYHTKPIECSVRPTTGQISHFDQRINRLTEWQREGRDVLFFRSQGSQHSDNKDLVSGLIWLRHVCTSMGHQVVASPTVRYILRGGRNRSVAVNSLSLVEIWETCTLLLKHPPTSRARTPLAHRRGNEGGYSNRHCPRECGRAAALRAQNWQNGR